MPPGERLKRCPGSRLGNHHEAARQDRRGALSDRGRRRERSSALPRCNGRPSGRIDDFPLGEHDTPDRLLIPEKLYGREREIETLLAAFDRVVDERHAGAGARLRIFRHRQILGRQ